MTKLKMLVCLVMAASLPFTLTGCTAAGLDGGLHGELDLGVIKAGVSLGFNSDGQQVFVMANPTDTDGWVQPVDSNGNPIGDPIPFPAGGIIKLPPGTDIEKTHLVKKPKAAAPKPKPITPRASLSSLVTIQPEPLAWGGGTTSFGNDGSSSTAEYSITAMDFRGVFAALTLLDQGASISNAQLVCRTSLSPLTRTSARLDVVLPSNNLSRFEVYVNGVLVASSATGMGGATVIYSTDGFGHGSASIPFSTTATTNTVQVITTDNLAVPSTRSISYGL